MRYRQILAHIIIASYRRSETTITSYILLAKFKTDNLITDSVVVLSMVDDTILYKFQIWKRFLYIWYSWRWRKQKNAQCW